MNAVIRHHRHARAHDRMMPRGRRVETFDAAHCIRLAGAAARARAAPVHTVSRHVRGYERRAAARRRSPAPPSGWQRRRSRYRRCSATRHGGAGDRRAPVRVVASWHDGAHAMQRRRPEYRRSQPDRTPSRRRAAAAAPEALRTGTQSIGGGSFRTIYADGAPRRATSSISTCASSGKPATATVVRAGYGVENRDA